MNEAVTDEHSGEYLRLARLWQRRTRFSLIFAAVEDSGYRDTLIARLDQIAPSVRIDYDPEQEPLHLVTALQNARASGMQHAHICMKAGIPIPALWWNKANVLRESMADALQGVMVFWLTDSNIQTAAHEAPDLWNWRETVLTFTAPTPVILPSIGGTPFHPITSTEKIQIEERLAQIENYLATQNELDSTTAHLYLEAAYIYERIGQLDKSEIAADEAARLFSLEGNIRLAAQAKGKVADIFEARGNLPKALTIHQRDILPIPKQIGDIHGMAITQGKIADIYQARGRLDEALAIRQNDELPVYEKINDIREAAITKGKIADIYQARGRLDEALTIHQNEVLPIRQKIGDLRGVAVAQDRIASILQMYGHTDEALTIYQNEVLPIREQMGDVRAVAIAKGKIADIYQARGQLNEALAIYQNQVLPILEQCGYESDAAIARKHIAALQKLKQQQAAPIPRLQQFDRLLRRAIPAPPHRSERR